VNKKNGRKTSACAPYIDAQYHCIGDGRIGSSCVASAWKGKKRTSFKERRTNELAVLVA
jgi:hypothetical protein